MLQNLHKAISYCHVHAVYCEERAESAVNFGWTARQPRNEVGDRRIRVPSVRRSMALMVRQKRTANPKKPMLGGAMAVPMVGENSIGMRAFLPRVPIAIRCSALPLLKNAAFGAVLGTKTQG